MPIQEKKKTISVTEASKEIGVCTATIRRAIKTGRLKAFRLSDKINATYSGSSRNGSFFDSFRA